MVCPQCQGIEESFDQGFVAKKLTSYHARGSEKTTRMLTEAIKATGINGLTLLDIGGGIGAVQHELLAAGVQRATAVEASSAYLKAAKAETARRGLAERVSYRYGNFVDLAGEIPAADIVTLDRVICCYHEMEKLVGLSAGHARRLYGLVYPRDTWLIKLVLALGNLVLRLQRSPFRTFAHSSAAVEKILRENGFKRHSYQRGMIWQVVVYTR